MNPALRAAAFLALATSAESALAADYDSTARVLSVQPHFTRVSVPRQECHLETFQRQESSGNNIGAEVLGGVTGALVGSRFGRGNGRVATTIVGAVGGAIAGNAIANAYAEPQTQAQTVERCTTVYREESRQDGYDVTYEYDGRSYTVPMARDPGERVAVRVSVVPRAWR